MSKEATGKMTGEFGRMVVTAVKRAFYDGASECGVLLKITDGPHGFLSLTVPVRFEWTGSPEAVRKMTAAAEDYCRRMSK
jgi:hypothetical protein